MSNTMSIDMLIEEIMKEGEYGSVLNTIKDYDSYYCDNLSAFERYDLFSYIDFLYYKEIRFKDHKDYKEIKEQVKEINDLMSLRFIEDFIKAYKEDKEDYGIIYDERTYDILIVLLEKKMLEKQLENF